MLRVKNTSISAKGLSPRVISRAGRTTIYEPVVLSETHTIDAEGNKRKKSIARSVFHVRR